MVHWALIDTFPGYLSDTAALAAVALLGYIFGRRSDRGAVPVPDPQLNHELARAATIASELQQVAGRIRQDVAFHQTNIARFKTRVTDLESRSPEGGWLALSTEAESLLGPTMKLATNLSLAYDELRKQSLLLMNFAGSRTDPDTGIHNRRAMEEQLEVLLFLHKQNATRFSLALISLDCQADQEQASHTVREFVQLLKKCARDSDVVARYSKEEFVVLMPQTSLPGSIAFSERLLRCTDHLAHSVLAIGLVEVQADDDAPKLLSRADSALYSARAQGFHSIYKHNGKTIKEHKLLEYADPTARATEPTPDPATEPATEPTPEAPNATR